MKKMMKFDIKKVFVQNKPGNQDRYYILVKVNLERLLVYNPMFDNFELNYLLNQTTKSLLTMVPFTIRNLIFDGLHLDIT